MRGRHDHTPVERTLALVRQVGQQPAPVKLVFAEDDERLDATKLVGYSTRSTPPTPPAFAPLPRIVHAPPPASRAAPMPAPAPRGGEATRSAGRSVAALFVGLVVIDVVAVVIWYALSG